jgi:ribosomal protein S18 acetylase RimI-like enzyme
MAARISLRAVRPSDLPLLTRMSVAFNEEDGHPLTSAGKRALKVLCDGSPHGLAFIVERDKIAIGYVAIGLGFSIEYGGIDAFLDEFYIDQTHRGAGAGTAALQALAKIARKMKIKAMHLEAMDANERAGRLYERMGFRLMSRRLMSKRL